VATTVPRVRIYMVNQDASAPIAMARLLREQGHAVFSFQHADMFLEEHDPQAHGCVILDAASPGFDSPALQRVLAGRDDHMPVIVLGDRADAATVVRAMRHGAFDFLAKPVDETALAAAVAAAVECDCALATARARRAATEARLAQLTPRERQVFMHVMSGRLNKQIAAELGTTLKTVKVHRARVMLKMQVRSVADLVRLVERTQPRSLEPGLWPCPAQPLDGRATASSPGAS